jgi:outer membrane lipoprotein SlyB
MNVTRNVFVAICLLGAVGCAEQLDSMNETEKGAAAGGAMGGTLGALVGSQTGNAGTGLVVGAIAGSATGASVGYVLDDQQKAVKDQAAAIDKRDEALKAQGAEIESLRQNSRDSISFRGDGRMAANTYQGSAAQGSAYQGSGTSAYGMNGNQPAPVRETTLAVSPNVDSTSPTSPTKPAAGNDGFAPRLSNDGPTTSGASTTVAAAPAAVTGSSAAAANSGTEGSSRAAYAWNSTNKADLSSPDCVKAQSEVKDAAAAAENADKLFHYRRAIRLCPNNPENHNALGQVYLSLDRKNDAEFEFKEALNIDTNYEPAKQNLSNITR